jgi:diaminopimelate decarboxylase
MTELAETVTTERARLGRPPWPAGAAWGPDGLGVGGVSLTELAEHEGTPLLVVDEDELRSRMRAAALAFPRVFFAVKAFTAHAPIRIAAEEGLDVLAASNGELEACLRAGVGAGRIALHGRHKTDRDLDAALEAGVGLVIADTPEELRRLDALGAARGRRQDALLRIVPAVTAPTHEAIATGHEASTFGTSLAEAEREIPSLAALPSVRILGFQAHLGSQLIDLEPYLRELDALLALSAAANAGTGFVPRLIDVGGGFGIAYTDEPELSIRAVGEALTSHLHRRCEELGLPVPLLAAEPGRALVANPVLTLYRVGTRKTIADGRTAIVVDGGMSDNIRPALYGARYAVAAVGRPRSARTASATVVGIHCESGDVLAADVELPDDVGPGDLVAFAATGAYTYSLASAYNRVGRPAVVAVRDGAVTRWLRREDPGDLDRLERPSPGPVPDAAPPAGVMIRPATPRDTRSFLEFWNAIVAEGRYVRSESVSSPPRVYRSRFRRSWTEQEAQLVALDGGRVVGHVYVQREAHPVTRHVATLGIAVAPDWRGRGIGAALMAEGVRWARSVGVERLMLSVYPHNTAAIALYRKFGFIDEGRLVRHSRKSTGDEDEILMATWLGPEASPS